MAGARPEVTSDEVRVARRVAELVSDEVTEIGRGQSRKVEAEQRRARRVEVMALRLAGFSLEQIAERFDVTSSQVDAWISDTLAAAEAPNVAAMRSLENQRLDRAQSAIWSQVVAGNLKAIDTFMRLSQQRSKINGLYAATKIDLSVGIRHEMETALTNLENLVSQQAEILDADVVEDSFLRQPGPGQEILDVD